MGRMVSLNIYVISAVQQAGQVVNSETFLRITVTYLQMHTICCFVRDCFNFPGRPDEKLLLVYGTEDGLPTWIAYEGKWDEETSKFHVRQAVFRTKDTTVTTESGQHSWEMNQEASKKAEPPCPPPNWQGALGCTTKNVMRSGPCVSDSAPVSDDRPIQSAPCVSDSAPVSDDRPGRVIQSSWRGTKRTHPKPESADSLTAAKKMGKMVDMHVESLGAKRTSEMLACWSFFPSPHARKEQVGFLTVLLSDIVEFETTIREALSAIDLSPVSPADPTKMPSDKWLTSLSKSKRIIDLKLSLLTQQKLLEEFLRDCQWVNAYIQSSQVNVMQTRRHLRRCPVKGQAFVDWFKQQRNAFDTQALKEYGWLKMNAFIDGCLHVVPSSGQQFPFTDHFKGAVVLETIDFSVSDLSKFGKDDPIPHGLLQVTVMPAPLQKNCNLLPEQQAAQFADRIANMLQSLVFFIEALSEKNECFLNLWVADFDSKTNYGTTRKSKKTG